MMMLALATSLKLLQLALDPNPSLQSYTATAELFARVHGIPVSQRLGGTAYYARPRGEIVFDRVPPPLRQFRTLATSTPTFAEATAKYAVALVDDNGTASTFELDSTQTDTRVAKLVIVVDDKTALLTTATWFYRNGARLVLIEHYLTSGPYRLPDSIAISAHFPAYAVDGTINLTNYQTGVDVPASLFPQ